MAEGSSPQEFWQQRAAMLSRRVNLAWFLQILAAPLLVTSVLGAIATVIIRREFPDITPLAIGIALLSVLLILCIVILAIAWKRFEKPDQSLVRIEASGGMNSALSAASAGVSAWPEKPAALNSHLRWHLPKTLIPPLSALALLALGLIIPISAREKPQPPPSQQPQAWSQIDSQLEQLADDAAVDEEYIEEMQKRLEQLKAQEEKDWFSHASLEATDTLEDAHKSNMDELQRDMDEMENALEALAENADKLTTEQKQKLTEEFESALEGLENGAMKPNPELLDQLSKLDPNNLGKLTPEQLSQLKENMQKLQESLDKAGEGQGQGEGDDWDDQLLGDGEGQGEGQGSCPGGNCPGCDDPNCSGEGTGSGGIQRGPGHDPNVLRDPKDPLDTGDLEALEAKDLSRAIPGDLLQLTDGEHNVDEDASKSSAGGSAEKGKGGDRVWRDSLAPDEQRALKKFFE
jgi:hypothetical protein